MGLPSFENIKPATAHEAGVPLPSSVYTDSWGPPTPGKQLAPAAADALKQSGLDVPAWLDQSSAAQLKQIIDDAEGKQQKVNFTTPGENAAAGVQPDYRIDENGKLIPTGKPHNPGDPINIQVESKNGETQAKQYSQQLQRMSLQEQIAYFKQWHPNDSAGLNALQNQLAKVSQAAAEVQWPTPPANQPGGEPNQVADSQGDTPGGGQAAPAAGFDGGSPGGSAGGSPGGGNWRGEIGQAPESGFTPGKFDPGEADKPGPMDPSQIPKPVAGDLPIKFQGDKPPSGITAKEIQQFLVSMGSPAASEPGFSDALYRLGVEHHIDPAVALGFFLQESTCGRAGRAVHNHSFGNIIGTSPEGMTDGKFRKYSSWEKGAEDWYNLIDKYNARGLTTLSQVIHTYAPASDGNNERGYVATVKGTVAKFASANEKPATA